MAGEAAATARKPAGVNPSMLGQGGESESGTKQRNPGKTLHTGIVLPIWPTGVRVAQFFCGSICPETDS